MSAPPAISDPARQALEHLDRVLAQRPETDQNELSATLRCLTAFRDRLTAARRQMPEGAAGLLLAPVNGAISVVLAAQYPLGDIPWDEVAGARDQLSDVLAQNDEAARAKSA